MRSSASNDSSGVPYISESLPSLDDFFEDLSTDNIERSEDELITEFLNNNNLSCDAPLCTALLSLLSSDCPDGESKQSFEQRIISSAKKLLFADDNGV